MSALLAREIEEMGGGPITVADLLYEQLKNATAAKARMTREDSKVPYEATVEWCLAHRDWEQAIDSAIEHANALRAAAYAFSPLLDQLMRAHNV